MHLDSHPDMLIPKTMLANTVWDKNQLFRYFRFFIVTDNKLYFIIEQKLLRKFNYLLNILLYIFIITNLFFILFIINICIFSAFNVLYLNI